MNKNLCTWAKGKPEYENIFTDWGKAYEAWRPYAKHRQYINEGISGSPLIAFAASLMQLEAAMVKAGTTQADIKKAVDAADVTEKNFLEEENKISDQNIVAAVTRMFYEDVDKEQHPVGFYGTLKNTYGPLDDDATYKKYAADIFSKTMILDDAKWNAFVANPDAVTLQSDPAFAHASCFLYQLYQQVFTLFPAVQCKEHGNGKAVPEGYHGNGSCKSKDDVP